VSGTPGHPRSVPNCGEFRREGAVLPLSEHWE
jgi:hypothetical protein